MVGCWGWGWGSCLGALHTIHVAVPVVGPSGPRLETVGEIPPRRNARLGHADRAVRPGGLVRMNTMPVNRGGLPRGTR